MAGMKKRANKMGGGTAKKKRAKAMGGGMMKRSMYSKGTNGKPISKSKNPGLVKLAKKKPKLAKKFGYDAKRIVAKKGGKI